MNITKFTIELFFGFLSSFGFGVITNIPRRVLLPAGLTGALSWGAYCWLGLYTSQVLWQNLVATIVIGYLGNFFAVRYKTPVTMLYIPGLVSLVPGALAAIGMQSFVRGQQSQAGLQMQTVFLIAIALTIGFIIGESLYKVTNRFK